MISPPTLIPSSDAALATFGYIDILVNNASRAASDRSDPSAMALVLGGPILESEDEAWVQAIDVDVLAPLKRARAFAPGMLEAGTGAIINVASDARHSPRPTFSPYSVSKSALWMLTRSRRKTGADRASQPTLPGRHVRGQRGSQRSLAEGHPLLRAAPGDEAIGAALYLASERRSFLTVDMVFVNGEIPP